MEWLNGLPADAAIDVDGKVMPVRDIEFVKSAPDMLTFIKSAHDAHREVGRRVPVSVSKPEDAEAWRKTHLPTLYKNGLLDPPAGAPDKYLTKPEKMPDGLNWDDGMAKTVGEVLHKHGAPAKLGPALAEAWTSLNATRHQEALTEQKKMWADAVTTSKTKYGDKFDEKFEAGKRLAKQIYGDDAAIEDYPDLLPVFLHFGTQAQADSSFVPDATRSGGGSMKPEDVKAEVQKIMTDKTHPMHAGYWSGDRKVQEHIEGLYKKAHGDGQVTVDGGGITVGA